MAYLDYSLIPYKEKRSTGERVLRNAFYMPDPKLHKSSLYSGDYPDDFCSHGEKRERSKEHGRHFH